MKPVLTEEPCLPRHRKIPRRYDEGGQAHQFADPKARYRQGYFETLELAAGDVEKRFDHKDIHTIKEIETLLLNAGNGETIDSFLRSTMTECRLNNLFLLYVHKSVTDALDLSQIVKDFVSVNSRRRNYFGKF